MIRVSVKDIEWDTVVDGEEYPYANLPTEEPELYLDVYLEDHWTEEEKDDAVAEVILDYLSDEYGYCVSSITWEYL